jgi:tRNA A22 N-methylase
MEIKYPYPILQQGKGTKKKLNDLDEGVTKGFNLIKKKSLEMDKYQEDLNSLSKIKSNLG